MKKKRKDTVCCWADRPHPFFSPSFAGNVSKQMAPGLTAVVTPPTNHQLTPLIANIASTAHADCCKRLRVRGCREQPRQGGTG